MRIASEQKELVRAQIDRGEVVTLLGNTVLDSISNDQIFNPAITSQEIILEPMLPQLARRLEQTPTLGIHEVKGSEGLFNVTVLDNGGVKYLFGRKVQEAAEQGQPDFGSLVMAELGPDNNIISMDEVWNPKGQDILIEDPRAHQTIDGKTIIGVTAVRQSEENKTYPAFIKLDSPDRLLTHPFPKLHIIEKFGNGSQATPLGETTKGKNATTVDATHIMYRPDGLNHALQVFEYINNDANHVGFIDFPKDIPGATYKIGTTTPPEWINDHEAFFIFHGIDKTIDGKVVDPDTIDDRVIYHYSIHTARLLKSINDQGETLFSVDNISRAPIITPDSFPRLNDSRQIELHPEIRRVTYSCGGTAIKNPEGQLIQEKLFVNQGDKRTWVVIIDAVAIISSWDRRLK